MFSKQYMRLTLIFSLLLPLNLNPADVQAGKVSQEAGKPENSISIIDPFTQKEMKTFTPDEEQLLTNVALYKEQLEAWVQPFAKKLEMPMILDKIGKNGEIVKGRPLITINEPALVEKLIEHTFVGGRIELPLNYTESQYDQKDVPSLNEVVLSSYSTYFNAHTSGRSKNIELSANAIDQVIMGHKDIFSFNLMVGPREEAAGYKMAPEIVKGKMVMGIGGGICQTSSTLFNAVDQLQLQILERHHHSKDVGYVPKGRDATVSFGGLDFKFQNTTGIPLLIKTYFAPGSITVQIKTSKEYAQILEHEL